VPETHEVVIVTLELPISPEPEAAETASDERIASLEASYARPLFAFLLRLSYGQRDLAEDLLQETMIRAWRNLDSVPTDDDGARGWLFTVARRIAIDAARMRQARPTEVDLQDLDLMSAANPTTDTALAAETLRHAIRGLTREQRMILNELYIHGSSTQEAAQRLGMPVGTVKSRTFHALRRLRNAVAYAE
jgi:RNA polymerase sigma-70 factor (ECF subfamily)